VIFAFPGLSPGPVRQVIQTSDAESRLFDRRQLTFHANAKRPVHQLFAQMHTISATLAQYH